MTDPKYMLPGIDFATGKLVEELGELQAAIGKTMRWGRDSFNPEMPPAAQEPNWHWIEREIDDVLGAIANYRKEAGIAALEQAGEPVEKLHYSGDVMEAVQKLLERGRATLDNEGYLVSLPVASPMSEIQRLGQEFDAGEVEPVAWMYKHSSRIEPAVLLTRRDWADNDPNWTETPLYSNPPYYPAGLRAIAERIMERGYISEYIDEERADYLALKDALAHPPQSRVAAEPVGLRDALEPMPCPFCAASFRHVSDKDGEFWMHSGVITDDDCFMSGQGIFPRQLSAWNRRAHAQPVADDGGVTQADREAAAKCVEHGLSRPNPLNVRQGVVDSWHLVQAFVAHRLRSVAAATAAKDAKIARLREALERIQPVACGDWCRDDKHIPECENALAALSEAREAGALANDSAPS